MGDLSNFYLILYIVAWFITFVYYQRKRRIIDAGSLLLLSYTAYAVLSYLFFNDKSEFSSGFTDLSLFPFVYLFIMLMMASAPVLRFDARKVKQISSPHKNVVYVSFFMFAFFSLLSFPSTISNIREGIMLIMLESSGGLELVNERMEIADTFGHGGLAHLPTVIASAFSNIGIFMMFFLLTSKKKSKLIIGGFALSIVLSIFSSVATGSRGGPIDIMLIVVATFFMFKYFYSDTIKRWTKKIGLIIIIALAIPIVAITISRFGEANSSSSVLRYTGLGNLNFNKYALDDNGIRYGDRTVPLFKRMMGFDNVPHNYVERRMKYPKLKINDETFCTFVGDFTIDYGPVLAFLIFLLFFIWTSSKLRIQGGSIGFRQLLLIHFALCVCIQGGMSLFSFADVGGNLKIIAYFLVLVYSKLMESKAGNERVVKRVIT